MTRVLAIDPGTRSTGVALVDDRGVLWTKTISFKEPCGTDNEAIFRRASEIVEALLLSVDFKDCDVVVMEGYEPFVTNGRVNATAATQLPILVGWLGYFLQDAPVLHVQYSREVLGNAKSSIYGIYHIATKNKTPEQCRLDLMARVPGGELCRTDHERAAAAHALWYLHEDMRLFD